MLEEPGLPLKLKSAAVGSMERQQHGAAASSSTAADSQHILKILVASDMHLGYGERDPVRGDDSFVTFREVFELALQHEADMVLLAGDLFHDNKPSRKALHKCMEIMRDHVFGERKVGIEVVSDQSANFHTKCAQQLHSPLLPRVHTTHSHIRLRSPSTGTARSISRTQTTTSSSPSSRSTATTTTRRATAASPRST